MRELQLVVEPTARLCRGCRCLPAARCKLQPQHRVVSRCLYPNRRREPVEESSAFLCVRARSSGRMVICPESDDHGVRLDRTEDAELRWPLSITPAAASWVASTTASRSALMRAERNHEATALRRSLRLSDRLSIEAENKVGEVSRSVIRLPPATAFCAALVPGMHTALNTRRSVPPRPGGPHQPPSGEAALVPASACPRARTLPRRSLR